MTRRNSVTKKMPRKPPTIIRALDLAHATGDEKSLQQPAITNAGSVNTAPAAIDSPIEPMVRAMFSSRIEPLNRRSTAIPMMAAGYVAAIVIPARSPRYAFAAPRITVMTRPRMTARSVISARFVFSGTNGTKRLGPLPVGVSPSVCGSVLMDCASWLELARHIR